MARRGNFQKPKNMKGTFIRLFHDFKGQRGALIAVFFFLPC